MRLVYRDIKIVVNFIINNFTEGEGIKGSTESALGGGEVI